MTNSTQPLVGKTPYDNRAPFYVEIIGWLSGIFIIGIIFSVLGSLLGLYGLIGIILTVLVFVKVIA